MNELIKRLAKKAHEDVIKNTPSVLVTKEMYEQKFAKLVAEAEREACAKDAEWCIQNNIEQHIPTRIRARGET